MDTEIFFPIDYEDARKKFIKAAEHNGLDVDSYRHPLKGLNHESLFTDVVWIGDRDAENVLVTSSSTHGPEGFLGSGVQVESLSQGRYQKLPKSTAVLLIHAINPWGFSWLRRTNEDGVDLFRNFIDFTKPKPKSDIYDILVDRVLVPKKLDFFGTLNANIKLAYFLTKFGKASLKAEIAKGQYKHAHGPFYGGVRQTWSNMTLRKILQKYLKDRKQVACIDYHTGLGAYSVGEIIGFDRPSEASYILASKCWGEKYVSVYSSETTAYEINGFLLNAYKEELSNTNIIFGAYEFGTIDEVDVFKALRLDHWFQKYGDLNSKKAAEVRRVMRDAFYSDDNVWREAVLKQATNAERQVLDIFDMTL